MNPLPDAETSEDAERRRPLLKDLLRATPLEPIAAPIKREWDRFAAVATPPKVERAAPREPGDRFGRYVLLGVLGRGGMGVVYRARDPALDRTVALKLYGRELAAESETTLERFTQEARATARLSHRGIVRIHDVGREDGTPYLSMDLVPGESLEGQLHRIPLRRRLEHIVQVARALEHAHTHGVVHRDVKPSNIIIDPQGQAVLVDFGVARDLTRQTRLTRTGCIVGTVVRMSPEQVRGEPDAIGPKADVYALGVLLYEAVCGELPFEGSAVEMMVSILQSAPTWPEDLEPEQPELKDFAMRCLEKDPSARYASAGALASALATFLERTPDARLVCSSDGPTRRSASASGRALGGHVSAEGPRGAPRRAGAARASRRARGPRAAPLGWVAVALVLGGGALALLWPSAPDAPPPEAEVVHASPAAEVEDRPQAAAVVNTAPLEIDVFGDVEEPSRERVRSIRGRVSCPPGAKLGLDDEPVPVSEDGSFTLGPELSGDGLHSLTLVLRDGAGGEVTRELRLRLDTTPPALRVTSPEVAVVGSATVTFRGVVEAEDLDRLLVDGRPVALLDDGSFEAPVVLEGEGLREVVIEAIDAVGNRARLTRRVTYDATAPTVLLEAPEDEALTRSARVGVRGRISDAHPPREVHVSVAGVTAGTASVDSDGRFALEVAVPEGRSALLVRCKDQAGHAASATRIVARDSQAPVITLAHALPGALYGARARYLTLSGSVDDVHARLTVCGKPIKLSRKGRFRERVRLRDGANPIDVVALDRAGNRGEVTGVVEYARRRAKPAPVQVLFYEDFTKASGRKGDAVALLEGGIARSKSTDKIFAAVLQVADYGTHALVTLLPGAKLRLRYRISAPTRGSFKLQLYCAAAKDNLWLFLPLPPDLEWQEIEVDLGRLRTGSPPEALEPVAYTCDNVQLLLGKAGEAVVLEVDDLLIFAPAGER